MAPVSLKVLLVDNTSKDIYDRLGTPAAASIAADLVVLDNFIDTEIAAIQAKTDQLTFGVANVLDVRLANAVTHGGATALLRLGSTTSTPAFYATNSGGHAFVAEATAGNTDGVKGIGFGTGTGFRSTPESEGFGHGGIIGG
jgi:hypothetical protein